MISGQLKPLQYQNDCILLPQYSVLYDLFTICFNQKTLGILILLFCTVFMIYEFITFHNHLDWERHIWHSDLFKFIFRNEQSCLI